MAYKFKADNAKRRRKYYQKEKKRCNIISNRYRIKIRKKVIENYGGKCVKCGFSDERALQIDHINGGGTKERRELNNHQILLKIVRENYPKDYQVLCANCNSIKRIENKEHRKAHSD